ncbi:hypothetical protein PV383_19865 [Streptomyces caniscabiei]|uniref:Uncharacterized protein n=1 Tax=Streptomyces caniscabiei TaxID=2746961 RepID=A0ABU4MSC1_9ACTN|nr:hypothetical protein [Streptomyces caniscabiei]MBE4758355.1 hypothetical protein [Streptomyces caniscabiei]MBE4788446.1 hypothetical protein [Streptomyces caniscabiei]MDX2986540.1 hypothetical protein [Streptomyces caniscabiei]MDX3039417.1 hypothetical protein [Streptomyces caniscabiei]
MSRHEEMCPHCRAKAGLDSRQAGTAEPFTMPELPGVPTLIRVHTADGKPFDCTLHPDGTLTAVIGGEVRRNFLSFADMCERNWAAAHFEWDPQPLPAAGPEPEKTSAVQESFLAA